LLRHQLRRLSIGLLTTASAAIAFAGPAHAGILVSSAASCSAETLSQPFLPWLDVAQYTPVPGGSFEPGSPAWSLTGNAGVTSGNESNFVNSASDGYSLSLPTGSSATSPSVCVGIQNPTLRFFARNGGSLLSGLRVDVLFEDALGNVNSAPLVSVSGGSAWAPSLTSPIVVNLLPLLPPNMTAVAFRFTPVGIGGDWHIDDVYVDPVGRGG
jgi:hypothetical protein